MKKVFCLMLALCMLALIPVATAEVYSERALPLLTVTGEAQVLLAADSAVMNLGVTTKAATVAEASATNATTLDTVINALHDAGVDAADIVTQDYSVSPVYDYQYGKLGDGEAISAYQVSNRLKVTVSNVNELGTVLDAAMKAGGERGLRHYVPVQPNGGREGQGFDCGDCGSGAQGGDDGEGQRQEAGRSGCPDGGALRHVLRRDPEIRLCRRNGYDDPSRQSHRHRPSHSCIYNGVMGFAREGASL